MCLVQLQTDVQRASVSPSRAAWAAELTANTCGDPHGSSSKNSSINNDKHVLTTHRGVAAFVSGHSVARTPQAQGAGDDGDSPMKRLVLAPHHKTGFVFSKQSIECINNAYPDRAVLLMGRFLNHDLELPPDVLVAHINRDPIQLAVSTYLYNKFAADTSEHEPAVFNAGSAHWAKKHIRTVSHEEPTWMQVQAQNESFREYLRRVPVDVGLRAVFLVTLGELDAIEQAVDWCDDSEQCMEVHLDILTRDSRAYILTWLGILQRAGIEPTPELETCLSSQDTNHPSFMMSSSLHHCASAKVTHEQWRELVDIARTVDAQHLNGRYALASVRYLQRQHSTEFRRVLSHSR